MLLLESNHTRHASCQVTPLAKTASAQQLAEAETVFLLVRGMGCPTCALRVRNGLLQIEGVIAVDVVLSHGLAKVWYDPEQLQPGTLPARLPALADDGRHHYSASLIVFSGEQSGGYDASPH